MKQVWKFTLALTDFQRVTMPMGAQLLSVQTQGDKVCLWALVDPEVNLEQRPIWIHGTGHKIDPTALGRHIGTFQLMMGELVFHAFEGV